MIAPAAIPQVSAIMVTYARAFIAAISIIAS